jgi:hypothetical protein
MVCSAYKNEDVLPPNEGTRELPNENAEIMRDTLIIKVGNKVFKAILEENAAVSSLKAMLPFTIDMRDLNGNEKFFDFQKSGLPANASNPGTINSGDLMLWGSNTLVLFYKTFTTTYSYTRLGAIEDPNGLLQALGSGNVTVTFALLNK